MRIGDGGATSLYKAVNRDKEWKDQDNTEYTLTTGLSERASVTLDMDVLTTDGSYQIAFLASNKNVQSQDILMKVYRNGTQVGDLKIVSVAGDATHQLFLFSGEVEQDFDSGDVISVKFGGSTDITLNGSSAPTTLTVVKAEAITV
jgi:hypothetical protein